MEIAEKENYLGIKYYLDDFKKLKSSILTNPTTFTGFDRMSCIKDVQIKEYYDTKDFFFQERSLNIYIRQNKGSKTKDLVVRFNGGTERIRFLSNIPDTFSIKIDKKDTIYNHAEFLAESISQLIPAGLTVDIASTVKSLVNIFTLKKKRERYKYISIKGLKLNFDFNECEFTTKLNRNKEKMAMLEITSNNVNMGNDFEAFTKKVLFNNPTLIKLKNSDMALGKEYLFDDMLKKDDKKEEEKSDNNQQ